uniref:Uncharacterized protein n=1 Tax=Candidatus Kentrum eta TaxID=2126337 RepID=A0A450URF2_9GAMM|nr:MAG: hypothetical protein BECKH772A_GA0070896_100826 [Candidatus Kentron sp. H]VFJ95826.1 MAG: hypothetical protein BECKH772B_GA0070898_100826 [Candidatus Kentron sp. H]VFK02005.1 MAG: hypothetical protein BECKH772C_GA0070978_100796 [Candidatus Kentron sp. H]
MGDHKAIMEITTIIRQEIHKSQPFPQPADLFPVMRCVLRREDKDSRNIHWLG